MFEINVTIFSLKDLPDLLYRVSIINTGGVLVCGSFRSFRSFLTVKCLWISGTPLLVVSLLVVIVA